MVDTLAVGLAMALIAIGVVGIIISGIRNIINGKSEFKRIAVMIVPVIIFVATYALSGSFDQAGVATMVVMIGLMIVSIFVTGTRGTFKF
ncbi:MAG: hypothetical protein EA391_02605 [Balneolaceae bacterium]|nr:MAG: hypothetical protein EA391_02605 [Balneolaceae bacterium]